MKLQLKPKFYGKSDLLLIGVFIVYVFIIISNAIFHPDGYISPDSTFYFKLSESLLNGDGFMIGNLHSAEKEFPGAWPIGFPILIFIISKITFLDVFWAEKVLSILCILIVILITRKYYYNNAYIIILALLTDSAITNYSKSYSEGPFITVLILIAFTLYNSFNSKNNKHNILLIILLLVLFLLRYIGAFMAISLILFNAIALFKNKSKSLQYLYFSLISISFYIIYGLVIKYLTGYISGVARVFNTESNYYFFYYLLNAINNEINPIRLYFLDKYYHWLLLISPLQFYLIFKLLKFLFKIDSNMYQEKWFYFGFIGFSYLLAVIILRYIYYFDHFTSRLLGPGTILVLFAVFDYHKEKLIKIPKYIYILFLLFISVYYSPIPEKSYEILIKGKSFNEVMSDNYLNKRINVIKKYSEFDTNSLVCFANLHTNYLCPQISSMEPITHREQYQREKMDHFIDRITESTFDKVYIEVIPNIDTSFYHPSVIKFMEEYKGESFVEIK